ncbi:MAG: trigger factor [Chromatiales bacterium]|jgi:trigger factor
MQVSVESTGELERKLTIEVPSERIDGEVEKRLRSMAGQVRISGFRPGKVPFKVVKQRYGKGVYQEVLGDVLQRSFAEAVTQEQLHPAGSPQIEAKAAEPGKALEYVATFEIYPEFEVATVDDLEISKPVAEVSDADVDKMLETLRNQRKAWETVDRAAGDGDRLVIDFEGSLDGEPFEGGKGEGVPVVLGEGRLIADFEGQLAGLTAGESKTMDVNFPEDYPTESLAGKVAQFQVTAQEVAEARLPDLDESFAEAFGVTEGGVEALRREVRANLERELEQAVKNRIKTQVMDGLHARNAFEVPKALIGEEIARLRQQAMSSMGQQDAGRFPDSLFEQEAQRRVALGLVIAEMVKRHEIKLDADRLNEALQQMASTYEDPQQVVDYYRRNQQAMASLEAIVLEDQVVEWVVEHAKVSEQAMSFDELMNPETGDPQA